VSFGLVLDDRGIPTPNGPKGRDMLEILKDRSSERATVIASQFPAASLYDVIGDPTMAEAILDRVIHNAYKVALKGESRRKGKEGTDGNEEQQRQARQRRFAPVTTMPDSAEHDSGDHDGRYTQ
jgi:hypothetical protein